MPNFIYESDRGPVYAWQLKEGASILDVPLFLGNLFFSGHLSVGLHPDGTISNIIRRKNNGQPDGILLLNHWIVCFEKDGEFYTDMLSGETFHKKYRRSSSSGPEDPEEKVSNRVAGF